jgi:hypothetical protein
VSHRHIHSHDKFETFSRWRFSCILKCILVASESQQRLCALHSLSPIYSERVFRNEIANSVVQRFNLSNSACFRSISSSHSSTCCAQDVIPVSFTNVLPDALTAESYFHDEFFNALYPRSIACPHLVFRHLPPGRGIGWTDSFRKTPCELRIPNLTECSSRNNLFSAVWARPGIVWSMVDSTCYFVMGWEGFLGWEDVTFVR